MSYIATTLRPGFLVSPKTSITGNVKYKKDIITADTLDEDGTTLTARWETERTVKNAAEQEQATKIRSRVRTLVEGPCSKSGFGLLCPEATKADLDKAIAEARALVVAFNETATTTHLAVNVLTGKIDPNEKSAIKAINSEIAGLLDVMKSGLEKLDVKAVREAAKTAVQMGQMLSPSAAATVRIAIDAVRATANKAAKAAEVGAFEIEARTLQAIAEARTAFLDLDDAEEVAAPMVSGRAVDFTPEAAGEVSAAPAGEGRVLELA